MADAYDHEAEHEVLDDEVEMEEGEAAGGGSSKSFCVIVCVILLVGAAIVGYFAYNQGYCSKSGDGIKPADDGAAAAAATPSSATPAQDSGEPEPEADTGKSFMQKYD